MFSGIFLAVGPGYGNDGGFWYIGADGKLHRVPPWNPELFKDINAAATLLSIAQGIKQSEISKQLVDVSERLVAGHVKEIQEKTAKI
jgi:hypothetical protein